MRMLAEGRHFDFRFLRRPASAHRCVVPTTATPLASATERHSSALSDVCCIAHFACRRPFEVLAMIVRAVTNTGCLICDLRLTGGNSTKIAVSVGQGGANYRADVLTIQKLLNGVAPKDGGPTPLLIEDGLIGPLTRGAILAFQKQQNLRIQDDRIDPN